MKMNFVFASVFVLALSLISITDLSAQRTRSFDPEQMAEQQTTRIAEKLELSDEQTEQVRAINLKYMNEMKDIRSKANGDREAAMSMRDELQAQKEEEFKTVFTDEQYQTYTTLKAEQQNRKGKKRRSKN